MDLNRSGLIPIIPDLRDPFLHLKVIRNKQAELKREEAKRTLRTRRRRILDTLIEYRTEHEHNPTLCSKPEAYTRIIEFVDEEIDHENDPACRKNIYRKAIGCIAHMLTQVPEDQYETKVVGLVAKRQLQSYLGRGDLVSKTNIELRIIDGIQRYIQRMESSSDKPVSLWDRIASKRVE